MKSLTIQQKGAVWVTAILFLTAGLILLAVFGLGSGHIFGVRNIRQGLDLRGGVSILYEADSEQATGAEMSSAVSLLRRRLDAKGWMEASAGREGTRQIRVEIPGVDDPEQVMNEIGRTAQLFFADENNNILLTGAEVERAWRGTIQNNRGQSEIVVNLQFNSYGAALFEEATRNNLGKPIYIVMDNEVISDPKVNSVISEGRCYISGNYKADEAEYMATLIREGSLPFGLNVISFYNVGARLGSGALSTSILAGFIGIALLIIFMVSVYRVSGIAANIALLIYTGLMFVLISLLRITLTLPGIAGIVLTIGIAMDANIVVFECFKEELKAGKPLRAALAAAYKKAFPAILDSNITSLIVGAILFWLGTGPVKGFAQTFFIGTIVSMFAALVVARFIMFRFIDLGIQKPAYFLRIPSPDKKRPAFFSYPFMERRRIAYIASSVLFAAGVALMLVNGFTGKGFLNLDVEFSGGSSFTVDIGRPFENEDVTRLVHEVTGQASPQVQQVLNTHQVMVTIRSIDSDMRILLVDAFVETFGIDKDDITYSDISATVSSDMQRAAITALGVSFACMLVYITWRFKDLRMGAATLFALMHDAALAVAAYGVFRIPLNYSFIAVMLTIIGYSINANIILFDRLRDNKPKMIREKLTRIGNISIHQTQLRTIYSSLTTIITILVLYIIGVPSIKEFTLPLIIGIVVGTYSSLFLACPFWYEMIRKKRTA
jgi:SecD/SecF fusion protein